MPNESLWSKDPDKSDPPFAVGEKVLSDWAMGVFDQVYFIESIKFVGAGPDGTSSGWAVKVSGEGALAEMGDDVCASWFRKATPISHVGWTANDFTLAEDEIEQLGKEPMVLPKDVQKALERFRKLNTEYFDETAKHYSRLERCEAALELANAMLEHS